MASSSILIPIMLQYGGGWLSDVQFEKFTINGVLLNLDCKYEYFVDELYKQLNLEQNSGLMTIKYIVKSGSMTIYNDMSVRLYMEMKKVVLDINEFPLFHPIPIFDYTIKDEEMEEQTESIIKDPLHKYVEEGQLYWNKNTISSVMKHYAIRERFQFKVKRSSSSRGWRYCMPIIVVDGTFMKSAYKETMLSASVLDTAGHILPLAYAVVDSKIDTSWEWFFNMFNTVFGEREGMYIVSDRHDSILKAIALVYTNVAHCICIYHLWNNTKGRFKKNKKQLKGIFCTMARTYIKVDFDRLIEDINKIDNSVKEYLFDIGYEKWSIAHAHVNRSMFMTSNIAESVNSANKDARDLPIKKFLQFMMDVVMRWNNEHRQHSEATFTELENKYNIIIRENSFYQIK
ncbi:hypothetical protein P3L10_019520 [Capsicum annuum]